MFSSQASQVSGALYVDDVFSTYLYNGNGSTQTINNGINLSGEGGLVWIKSRVAGNGNLLSDTAQGVTKFVISNTTSSQQTDAGGVTAFNSTGFSLGSSTGFNGSSLAQTAWTFREAPKFFDIVTFTGSGNSSPISHSLRITPGMIIVKALGTTSNWGVFHRNNGSASSAVSGISLNSQNGALYVSENQYNTATQWYPFQVLDHTGASMNQSGVTYVAYLFAHDSASDGIIQCGGLTTDASGNATVNLGWEPQFLMVKSTNNAGDWVIIDSTRGFTNSGDALTGKPLLMPNSSSGESSGTGGGPLNPTATGFQFYGAFGGPAASNSNIYVAIRMPNKPPTTGTQVFSAVASSAATGTSLTAGFQVDMQITAYRSSVADKLLVNRLRGVSTNTTGAGRSLYTNQTFSEANDTGTSLYWNNTGFQMPVNYSGVSTVFWNFRRAPGVFDVVCYTGTSSARTVNHSLGVVPELMIVKCRSSASFGWMVYEQSLGATKYSRLDRTDAPVTASTIWNDTAPTSGVFSLGTAAAVNATNTTYVAHLFATKAGISKVFSYTGNGSSQTINCGFSTGARFILIKRTDSTGDWYVWDSTRGIVAGNDPYLTLNTTAAEVTTDDSIDPDSTGFIVNQVAATNINVNSATYIGLAFA